MSVDLGDQKNLLNSSPEGASASVPSSDPPQNSQGYQQVPQQQYQPQSQFQPQQVPQQYFQPQSQFQPQQQSQPNPSDQQTKDFGQLENVQNLNKLDVKGNPYAEKIYNKLVDLKTKDMQEAAPGTDINRPDIQESVTAKSQETDESLQQMLIAQHANASKVFSVPGEKLSDSPVETKFIRNQKGDVIGKEFFVKEHYLKDCLAMNAHVEEESLYLNRRYTLKISGDLVDKGTEIKFDMYNWRLVQNNYFLIFLFVVLLFSIIAFYAVGSALGYIGLLGFLGSALSFAAGIYWKWYNLEKRMNEASAVLLRKWTEFFKGFGEINVPGYKRLDKAVAFIEIVERTMKQKEGILVNYQNEMDGLVKHGFGKTYYRYMVFDNNLIFKQNYNNFFGLVLPGLLCFVQLIVIGTGAAFA